MLHPLFKICTAWYHPILFSGAPHPTNTTDTFAILFELYGGWCGGVCSMSIARSIEVRMSGGGFVNSLEAFKGVKINLGKDIRSAIKLSAA